VLFYDFVLSDGQALLAELTTYLASPQRAVLRNST